MNWNGTLRRLKETHYPPERADESSCTLAVLVLAFIWCIVALVVLILTGNI